MKVKFKDVMCMGNKTYIAERMPKKWMQAFGNAANSQAKVHNVSELIKIF